MKILGNVVAEPRARDPPRVVLSHMTPFTKRTGVDPRRTKRRVSSVLSSRHRRARLSRAFFFSRALNFISRALNFISHAFFTFLALASAESIMTAHDAARSANCTTSASGLSLRNVRWK